jgi:regulator of protease activity HflC (stomatin/prohibitin superfamily)
MVKEREVRPVHGGPVLVGQIAVIFLAIGIFILAGVLNDDSAYRQWAVAPLAFVGAVLIVLDIVSLPGQFTVAPNQAVVLQLFGRYIGTAREPGLRWANPLYRKNKVSLRVRNFESNKLKVNDHDGVPVEIAAIVVWRVIDSAEAVFEVDDYKNFVTVQSESALRTLATQYAYDPHEDGKISLRANTADVAEQLKIEIQSRLAKAGVEVVEARIAHLAYAQEIASAMLRRQQASAVVAARQKIVEGAVGMVEMALEMLEQKKVVALDPERKAAMVSNLLVVLCGEHEARPVVNTGTIYQ